MRRQRVPLLPLAGLCLLLLMLLPPIRHAIEARMSTHMLVQFPALLLAGALLAAPWAQRLPRGLQRECVRPRKLVSLDAFDGGQHQRALRFGAA